MLSHRGFSAWIMVDGQPLPEYLVAVDNTANRVSCWVPSEEGKNFSVYWKDHGGKVDTCGYIMLDGYLAPGRFLSGEGIAWRGGVRTGPASERPFVFQKVDEDAGADSTLATGKDVGTIVLRIKRVKLTSVMAPNPIQQLPVETHTGKNGIRIGFGAEQPSYEQYPSTWKVEPYDNPGQRKPNTYVSFIFRYRTLGFLHSQGIIEDTGTRTAPSLERQPQRRIVSMPAPTTQMSLAPNSSSTSRKPLIDPAYYRLGPQIPNRPATDNRRTVSLQASTEAEGEKPVNYPGEGMLIFPFQKQSATQFGGGDNTDSDFFPSPET